MSRPLPSNVPFGNVPINDGHRRHDHGRAGYHQIAGGGIDAPFSFNFDTCGAGGASRVRTMHGEAIVPSDNLVFSNGTTNVFECPIGGGSCIAFLHGTGHRHRMSVRQSIGAPSATCRSIRRPPRTSRSCRYRVPYRGRIGHWPQRPFSFSFDICGTRGGFAGPGTCNAILPSDRDHRPAPPTYSSARSAGGSCIAIPTAQATASPLRQFCKARCHEECTVPPERSTCCSR